MELKSKNAFLNDMTIDLKEIGWRLLEQWKSVFLGAVCIMALFLGFMHLHNAKTVANQGQDEVMNQPKSAQEVIDSLPENEQIPVLTAYQFAQQNEQLQTYVRLAPIMQIDPNNAKRLRSSWTTDNADHGHAIAMSYVLELQTNEVVKALINASGADCNIEQFMGLMFFTYPNNVDDSTVCLDLFLTDSMNAEAVQEELVHQVEKAKVKIQKEFGEHSIQDYRSEIGYVSDDRVYTKKVSTLSNMANINQTVTNLRNNFSDLQTAAFTKIMNEDYTSAGVETAPVAPKTITKRNVIAGLILGGIIYIGLYFLIVILSHVVISPAMFRKASVRVLGRWYNPESKKNALLRDRFIWKKHHKKYLDKEMALNKVSEVMSGICQYKGVRSLLLAVATDQSEGQEGFVRDLVDRLKADGIRVTSTVISKKSGNIDENVFMSADGVTVIAIDSKTKIEELAVILDCCNDYEKPVMGSVYLG